METSMLIYNVTIVNRGRKRRGIVAVRNHRIKAVSYDTDGWLPEGLIEKYLDAIIIDGDGAYLLPGVIDTHVHFRDPGLTEKADIVSESAAAVAGGVTSYIDMPNTVPQTTTVDRWEAKTALAVGRSDANYAFFIGVSADNRDELLKADYTQVPGIKLFLGSTTGDMMVSDGKLIERLLADVPCPIVVHAESEKVIQANLKRLNPDGLADLPVDYHSRIRSAEACYESSKAIVELARKHDALLHVAHVSTAAELELFTRGPVLGKRITAETCPQYLLLSDEDWAEKGARMKCNPAVKSASDREALRDAVRTGLIDTIATDHAPHLLADKEGGALKAKSGMPMVQFSLVKMLDLFGPELVVEKMCHNPARVFGIEERGFVDTGMYADFVLVSRRDTPHVITDSEVVSKCGWTPLAGMTTDYKVNVTILNGRVAYWNMPGINPPCRAYGKPLTFNPIRR